MFSLKRPVLLGAALAVAFSSLNCATSTDHERRTEQAFETSWSDEMDDILSRETWKPLPPKRVNKVGPAIQLHCFVPPTMPSQSVQRRCYAFYEETLLYRSVSREVSVNDGLAAFDRWAKALAGRPEAKSPHLFTVTTAGKGKCAVCIHDDGSSEPCDERAAAFPVNRPSLTQGQTLCGMVGSATVSVSLEATSGKTPLFEVHQEGVTAKSAALLKKVREAHAKAFTQRQEDQLNKLRAVKRNMQVMQKRLDAIERSLEDKGE